MEKRAPTWSARLKYFLNLQSSDYSFAGEAQRVETLLTSLDIESGYALDIAAADGVCQSCTLGLYRSGWRGLAIEYDTEKFAKLAYAYTAFPQVQLLRTKVTPENVAAILAVTPRHPEFLNLDIDSYDLDVLTALLAANYRPKLISMEINEKIPPPLYFSVHYRPDHAWSGDHFYGCSIVAAAQTVLPFGYVLRGIEANNAFFVEANLAARHGLVNLDVEPAYNEGYRDRPDRAALFPWNKNVDVALSMSPTEALAFFEAFFAKYQGRYELRL